MIWLISIGFILCFICPIIIKIIGNIYMSYLGVIISILGCIIFICSISFTNINYNNTNNNTANIYKELYWFELVGGILVSFGTCTIPCQMALIAALYPCDMQGEVQVMLYI